jgi:cell division transport system permease protein
MIDRWLPWLRLDVPLRGDASARFLPWIIAVMVYLAAIGGVVMITLGDTISDWDRSLTSTLTLQVPADTSDARLTITVAMLRKTPGIVSAQVLEAADIAQLLQPWLGNAVPIANLPLPRLIDIRIDPAATIDYGALRQHLDAVLPKTELDSNRAWLGSVRGFARRLEQVIGTGMVIVVLLTVSIVVFAAQIGLAIHRSVVELLHLLGARDAYIARQFQLHALSLGLRGGVIGSLAAAMTVAIVGAAGRALELPLPVVGHGILDWRLWLLLAVCGLVAGGIAMATARITVLRQLARMP